MNSWMQNERGGKTGKTQGDGVPASGQERDALERLEADEGGRDAQAS